MGYGQVSDRQWSVLAASLDVEQATLQAVVAVESSGSGFLPRTQRPKVLFEGHVFHRLTGGVFDEDHPKLSHAKWNRKNYAGSLAGEWKRLESACQLDRPAALQSASWGMFQIMGFNYPYCGCPDVETFVALQHAGVDEQIECFTHFVARPPFLEALQKKDWTKFAAAYNGPGHAKNGYVGKLTDAYAKAKPTTAAAAKQRSRPRKSTKRRRKTAALPPGRESFAAVHSMKRRTPRRRNVRPDPIDLRDWEYRPSIAFAPADTLLPNDPRVVKDQGETSACTGFALATIIEYLLDRGQRPAERLSGYMIYSMARRYDEWLDTDEADDTGSSLRGALKGWSRHGASIEELWDELDMPPPRKPHGENKDWWLDAVKRPMGAYYRIAPANIRDIHVALAEVGAVYASALTHEGWDALLVDEDSSPPVTEDDLPEIDARKGGEDQGHAFAIVGYTRKGFVVHNSWGAGWGRGGFAVLPYADWLRNAMDCWVVQLGAVTEEHSLVAEAGTIRVDKAGRAMISSSELLGDHEVAAFVINMENEGRLSPRGRFRTNDDDLAALLTTHLRVARERWKLAKGKPIDVGIYAHGGLTDEDEAAETARAWVPQLYTNRIFPIFLMWETGATKTVWNLFEDLVKDEAALAAAGGRLDRLKERFSEWKDRRLEGFARLPGSLMWGEMKQNAAALSGHAQAGAVKLFKLFNTPKLRETLGPVRLHLIGHSAGAIVHCHLGARARQQKLELASISLLAPAARLDVFTKLLGPAGVSDGTVPVLIAHLTDAAERNDDTCTPYGHSLLYLVSRSFEDQEETPILGMEKHLVPALPTSLSNARIRRLACPGGRWDGRSAATRMTTHGDVDDDPAVRQAVMSFIKESH